MDKRSFLQDLRAIGDEKINASIVRACDKIGAERVETLGEWLVSLRVARGVSTWTVSKYLDHVARLLLWLDDNRITDPEPSDLEEWHRTLAIHHNLAATTRGQAIASVRSYFRWREQHYGDTDPARFLRAPKIPKRLPKKLTPKHLQRLFATCADSQDAEKIRDYAIIWIFYATGARRSEVAGLRVSDIDLRVRTGTIKFHGKGNKERAVPIEGEPVVALQRWLVVWDGIDGKIGDHLWISLARGYGQKLRAGRMAKILQERAKQGRLPDGLVHPHIMRSTFASDMYDDGVEIKSIQLLMGHESQETTEGYIVISEKMKQVRMSSQRQAIVLGKPDSTLPAYMRLSKHDRR